ncbi:MAG TPA: hypothetical protein VFL79_03555 [Terriglobia bacterium]|nr:hypothetical protein [Terriglobia bacterium]
MDAESLAQIEHVVTNSISKETAKLREEFEVRLSENLKEADRHGGVLFEKMGRRLDLVVEGFEGLRKGQAVLRQLIEHESLELQSLMKLSCRQLQDRVETLEQRVQIIEKNLGLSA